jgi:hypothetical protein
LIPRLPSARLLHVLLAGNKDPDKIPSSWFGNMRVRDNSWNDTMAKAAAAGYKTVLSSPYYLNAVNQGSNFDVRCSF